MRGMEWWGVATRLGAEQCAGRSLPCGCGKRGRAEPAVRRAQMPWLKRSPVTFARRMLTAMGAAMSTLPVDSTTMTVMEMVIRHTPPSMPAAPMSAKPPGETRPPGAINESIKRPRDAPIMIQGTKRPDGRGRPYVRSANMNEKKKKRSVTWQRMAFVAIRHSANQVIRHSEKRWSDVTGGEKRVGNAVPGTFSRWKSSLTAPL